MKYVSQNLYGIHLIKMHFSIFILRGCLPYITSGVVVKIVGSKTDGQQINYKKLKQKENHDALNDIFFNIQLTVN